MSKEGRREGRKPIINHVLVFVFSLLAVMFAIMFFSTWVIIGVGILIVIFFASGYGFAALLGLIFGFVIFLVGFINNLIGTLTNPFGLLLGGF